MAHEALLYGMIEAEMLARSNAEWTAIFEAAGLPCAPAQSVAEMLAHPQTEALGILQPMPDSDVRAIGLPLRFDGERPQPRRKPPALGADTARIRKITP